MNKLFLILLENLRTGQRTSYLLTERTDSAVRDKARALDLVGYPGEWQIAKVAFVCTTPDDVQEEV